jgi:hypothetical protein
MLPSKRVSERVAPESTRQQAVRGFRSVVKHMDKKRTLTGLDTAGKDSDGAFALVSDDCIASIFRMMLIVESKTCGLAYFEQVDLTRKSVLSFAFACKRFARVLCNVCPELQAEALARSCTRVVPSSPYSESCFTSQMREELLSCDHLKMLRAAQRAMTCHCAKSCCHRYQKAFNKDIRKGDVFSRPSSPTLGICAGDENRLVTVTENCSLMAVAPSGNSAFVYARDRCEREHGDLRGRRFRDVIKRVELRRAAVVFSKRTGASQDKTATVELVEHTETSFAKTNVIEIDSEDMSSPLQMQSSQDGKAVAFIRALHEVDADTDTPFSSAFVWTVDTNAVIEVPRPQPDSNIDGESMSAQDVWFRTSDCGDTLLVVAWSTDFMHSSGHHVGSNAPNQSSPQYCFSTYILDHTSTSPVEHYETMFDGSSMLGTLLTCSHTTDGNGVVTLVKRRDILNGLRTVCKHDLGMSTSHQIRAATMNGPKGPVSAAVSPNGDCIVVACKQDKSFYANFLWQTGKNSYSIIHALDASPWMGLDPTDGPSDIANDLVKASVNLTFSPCGRFVALVDRHPLFGSPAHGHGIVIVDTAMRDKAYKFRPYPMFPTMDQAPRSFHWSRQGIWIMCPGTDDNGSIGPRGGALCLFAPVCSGFS